jgi:hypothetical protein
MTETKKRVPLAYVGWWNASHEDRWRHVGRVNAVEVDGYAPGTLMLGSIDCERIDRDVVRAVVRWHEVGDGFRYFDDVDNVVKHVPTEVIQGGTVDTSDWGLQPLFE